MDELGGSVQKAFLKKGRSKAQKENPVVDFGRFTRDGVARAIRSGRYAKRVYRTSF